MHYESFSDMMLDNRDGIDKGLRDCETKPEMIEKALLAYDFAVSEGIKHHESYKLLKAALVEELGKERAEEIERKAAKNFMQLQKGVDRYFSDVKSGRKVGYSAEK